MSKGLNMDMIGAVQLDQSSHYKLFSNPTIEYNIKKEDKTEGQSPNERKAKLLEYLTQQRKPQLEQSYDEHENKSTSAHQSPYEERPKRYGSYKPSFQVSRQQVPYAQHSAMNLGQLPNENLSSSPSQISILPPVRKSSYYLAHSIDISQPEYVSIKMNDRSEHDDIYYDNKKDNRKIANRKLSPDELNDAKAISMHSIKAPGVVRRNMEMSKESPFTYQKYQKDRDNERYDVAMERRDTKETEGPGNSRRNSISDNLQSMLPLIKSSSTLQLTSDHKQMLLNNAQQQKRDYLMAEVLQPMRKEKSMVTNTRLEKEIQKQVSLAKLVNSKGQPVKSNAKLRNRRLHQKYKFNTIENAEDVLL